MATISSSPPKPAVKPSSSKSSVSKSSNVKKPSSAPKPKPAAKADSVAISPKAPPATQTGNLTNGLQNNFGQRLDSQFRTHTVRPGESLNGLARAGLTDGENRPNGRQVQQGADIVSGGELSRVLAAGLPYRPWQEAVFRRQALARQSPQPSVPVAA